MYCHISLQGHKVSSASVASTSEVRGRTHKAHLPIQISNPTNPVLLMLYLDSVSVQSYNEMKCFINVCWLLILIML
jgi:hypothetical protein